MLMMCLVEDPLGIRGRVCQYSFIFILNIIPNVKWNSVVQIVQGCVFGLLAVCLLFPEVVLVSCCVLTGNSRALRFSHRGCKGLAGNSLRSATQEIKLSCSDRLGVKVNWVPGHHPWNMNLHEFPFPLGEKNLPFCWKENVRFFTNWI